MLPDVIHYDQVGFVRNRYMRDNVRKVVDIIDYAKKEHIQMMVFFADTEKGFDRIEWLLYKNNGKSKNRE